MAKNIITKIIMTGSEITGAIGGAVIGNIVAGPTGSLIGAGTGPIITKLFQTLGIEIKGRFLSQRETIRVGAAFTYALAKIQEYEKMGIQIRNDDFFQDEYEDRPASEEVLEGIILSAQREYEERKIKFLGNLYANISVDPSISREHANQLLKVADSLSFRQFCIIQLLKEQNVKDQELDFKIKGWEKWELSYIDIIAELRDLQQKGLVFIPNTFDGGDNSSAINLESLKITESGLFFHKILSLEEIDEKDLNKINDVAKIKK